VPTVSVCDPVAMVRLVELVVAKRLPCGPVAPVGPVGPTLPVGPVGPAMPVGPVGPLKPVGPVGPFAPIGPVGPVGPIPVGPVGPGTLDAAPVGPVGPIGPTAPSRLMDQDAYVPDPLTSRTFTTITPVAELYDTIGPVIQFVALLAMITD